jgi:acetyl-CoA carboxylase carboxyltransferase component
MSIQNNINDLTNRRAQIELGGGEAAIKKVHADGKLAARERVEKLLDTNSFVEVGAFVQPRSTDFNLSDVEAPADGVVTGYGTIEGRLVYVYSQDATVLGGALGEQHARKITTIYDMALKMGAPVIALIDSAGLRLQESTDALNGFGEIFLKQSLASGVVPQIGAILGNCGGGAAIIPSLSDFTFMTTEKANLFVNSPNALDDKIATLETYASANFHAENTGIVDFVCDSDEECLVQVRKLVDMLPSNNFEDSPIYDTNDDINRVASELNSIVSDGVDSKSIIKSIADGNDVVEVKASYGVEVVTALIRLNGSTVGVIANQTLDSEAKLTIDSCEKVTSMVKFCDSFNIPVVTITDVTGFVATVAQEKAGISKYVSAMTYAFANATVPKINIIVNRAFGSAYVAQNSKHIGADFVYAWPNAQISVMEAASAVKIMYSEEIASSKVADEVIANKTNEYANMQASPYAAASRGYIDDIIEPAATRKRLIAALEMLYTKRDSRPDKKHGTI